MFFIDFLMASTVAAILSGVVFIAWGRRSLRHLWPYFLVILLLAWAGGIWFDRLGEPLGPYHWIPFAAFGLLSSVLVGLATFPRRPHRPQSDRRGAMASAISAKRISAMADPHPLLDVGGFFYVFVGAVAITIVLFYFLKL